MFKAIRVGILLLILLFVSVNSLLTQARSTDWDNSLWVKVYPINADGSDATARYIQGLQADSFNEIESFLAREAERYGHGIDRPVRIELGREVREQPPAIDPEPGTFDIMVWSLKLRWWANSVGSEQDDPPPDVRMFVRYHSPDESFHLENSVGLQKGMVGVVNAYASRQHNGTNSFIIAHEFLHTLGATDKYELGSGLPVFPDGYADPGRNPLHPQRKAEIMGGRIALSEFDAMVPTTLKDVIIGQVTAEEIRLR
ncbi:MAG: hypothetical protein OEW35_09485 [Gammaproteobacteria bacterium]|nr:hypothetical protein [Gammaproteobacteria bacterium]MDH4254394.1 hypothetical protein [Gammaproteobacteria bacterium]MDH5309327.1 hypothetical protein [Gammaproteobacteria bacterium]